MQQGSGFVRAGTSVNLSLPRPTTVGNTLVVVVSDYYNAAHSSSTQNPSLPTDSYGNSWQQDASVAPAGTVGLTTVFSARLASAGANHQITVRKPGGSSYYIVAAFEVNNLAVSTWFDAAGTGVEQNTTVYSASVTTNNASDFLLGIHRSYSPSIVLTPAAAWRLEANPTDGNNQRLTVQSQSQGAAGNFSSTGTASALVTVDSVTIAYKSSP